LLAVSRIDPALSISPVIDRRAPVAISPQRMIDNSISALLIGIRCFWAVSLPKNTFRISPPFLGRGVKGGWDPLNTAGWRSIQMCPVTKTPQNHPPEKQGLG